MMTADLVRPAAASVSNETRLRGDSWKKATMDEALISAAAAAAAVEISRLQYDQSVETSPMIRDQLIFAAAAAADQRRSSELAAAAAADEAAFTYGTVKLAGDICFGCGGYIFDRFLLQVGDQIWHVDCLRCLACGLALEQLPSCYVRDDRVHCKACYQRHFGIKCARCGRTIQATDWVRRARQFVYHLACFACDSCKRQLSTGEEFALQDSSVLCKQHYMELLEGDSGKAHVKQKTKRVRTTFSEEQLQILQANFQIDSNPDGQDLERIAQMTGLSKRVTQVWFQNSRARQKKYQGVKIKNLPAGQLACSRENSIDIDCDDDECDDLTRSPSPSPGPSTHGNVAVNFLVRPNAGDIRKRLTIDDQETLTSRVDAQTSSSSAVAGICQATFGFEGHGIC